MAIPQPKIKNYTSAVPVDRTLGIIERELVSIGATSVQKDYKRGVIDAIFFSVKLPTGHTYKYRIPANADAALKYISEVPQYKRKPQDWRLQQSHRTAWRIVHDWVVSNCAMIRLEQAEATQVFLPYATDKNGETLYNLIWKDPLNRHKVLGPPQ